MTLRLSSRWTRTKSGDVDPLASVSCGDGAWFPPSEAAPRRLPPLELTDAAGLLVHGARVSTQARPQGILFCLDATDAYQTLHSACQLG